CETRSPFPTFASSTKREREMRRASTSNWSPNTTAAAMLRTRSTRASLCTRRTARPITSAESSISANSPPRFSPYENPRRTHPRDPVPRLHRGRGPVPLYRSHAFRLFRPSPVHRLHRSQLGQALTTLHGQTRKPRPRNVARVPGYGLRLSSFLE